MPRARKTADSPKYRDWVVDGVKPHLPGNWDVRPYTTGADSIERRTVFVALQSVRRLPEAPLRSHIVTYTVTLAVPSVDPGDADRSLDDLTVDLLHAIDMARDDDGHPILRWTNAERVVLFEQYRAVDVTVELITTANPKPTTITPNKG